MKIIKESKEKEIKDIEIEEPTEDKVDVEVEEKNNFDDIGSYLTFLIQNSWSRVEDFKIGIKMVEDECNGEYCEDIKNTLDDLLSNLMIDIGQLEKCLKLVDPRTEIISDNVEVEEENSKSKEEDETEEIKEDVEKEIKSSDKYSRLQTLINNIKK